MSTRETWVYPSDGGVPYKKGDDYATIVSAKTMFVADLPGFRSPIDGHYYSGRAGLRDHNARHNVVLNADLKGLPTLQTNSDLRSPEQRRASEQHRKETVIREVSRHYK